MTNIYQTAYDLVNTYVFGNTAVLGSYADLMCTIGATCACAILVALPFITVKWILRALTNTFGG